jgi:hypothetical protein
LNDKQNIAEHEVWQKSSNIFTSFALKICRQKKRGNNFCAFKQCSDCNRNQEFRPNEAWITWPTQTFAETCGNLPHVRLKRDRAANRG